jgi:hypothetical protein
VSLREQSLNLGVIVTDAFTGQVETAALFRVNQSGVEVSSYMEHPTEEHHELLAALRYAADRWAEGRAKFKSRERSASPPPPPPPIDTAPTVEQLLRASEQPVLPPSLRASTPDEPDWSDELQDLRARDIGRR